MTKFALGVWLLTLPCLVNAGTKNIYRDIDRDVTANEKQAFRLKLKKQSGVKMGRMAGVWGLIGADDNGDAFFLGKTPDRARLRFTLSSPKNHAPVQMVVTAKDGQKMDTHEFQAQPGETQEKWLALTGKVTVSIKSPSNRETPYAAYFWYPGERLDGLEGAKFNKLKSGDAGKVSSFARRKQGGQNND